MQDRLGTIVCKFGGDPAICLVEEAICKMFTDRQTDGRRTPRDCISSWNELIIQNNWEGQRCTAKVMIVEEQ